MVFKKGQNFAFPAAEQFQNLLSKDSTAGIWINQLIVAWFEGFLITFSANVIYMYEAKALLK